ncbi:OmpA/MotB [Nocardioidaceae bacterium Broad-1]|nr:OmpA/MotB [Nocardioidaceae bacterium Broad-1]
MKGGLTSCNPANPYDGATFDPDAGGSRRTRQRATVRRRPAYGAQPGYGQAPYGAPAAYSAQVGTPDSGATTAMVLGIIGLAGGFFCGLPIVLSPFALFMGLSAKKRIDAAAGALTGRGNAQAGFILGIIGTVLLVLSILVIAIIIVIGVSGGFDDGGYDSGYEPYDSEF